MAAPLRLATRLPAVLRRAPLLSRPFSVTAQRSQPDEKWPQTFPLGDYYESVLNHQPPYPFEQKPEEPPTSADPELPPAEKQTPNEPSQPPPPTKKKPGRPPKSSASSITPDPTPSSPPTTSPPMPSPPAATAQEKARLVFGSRVPSPAEQAKRVAAKEAQSSYIAGVLVPPRPEEPENCCMSGCVNCVWEMYRDDLEEWAAKKNEAQARMKTAADGGSVEDDGGRTAVRVGDAKIVRDFWDEEALQSVPVGIREFMRTEKRLKERHTQGGG